MLHRKLTSLLIAAIVAVTAMTLSLGSVFAGPVGIGYDTYLPLVRLDATRIPPPTEAPTATPTETQPTISLVSLTSPVSAGDYATLVIHFAPGAGCFLSYVTPHGTQSTAAGLGPTTADGGGNCGWTWKIGTNTYPGTGHLTVNVNNGQVTANYDIVIQ
jgi:hypothetical protein